MQKMPSGHFVRRQKEDGFKRQAPRRYERMAIDWLEWEAKNTGQHIRHQGVTMKHDAWFTNDAVLVQVIHIFILLIRYGEVVW
jgi:hypothetical protein